LPFRRTAFVAGLAATVMLLAAASTAWALPALSVVPDVPATIQAGAVGVPGSLTIRNVSTFSEASVPFTVDDATIVLTCGTASVSDLGCPGSEDPGVLVPATPTATGRPGTSCAGIGFTLSNVGQPAGTYRFVSRSVVVLGAAAGPPADAQCIIDFAVSATRLPAIDANPGAPGSQTNVTAAAAASNGTIFANGTGTDQTTIVPATPTISTLASPNMTLGAGALSDTATVTGRVNPTGAASVTFSLFGPDDPTCLGTPLFTSTVPVPGSPVSPVTVSSAPFTPIAAGTYRWVASYSGDTNNAAVAGACNDPGESVSVAAVTPPLVPPPPDSGGPTILSAAFQSPPRVGQTTFLVVRAVDPTQPISGLVVRFEGDRGLSGLSSCRVRSLGASLAATTQRLPYVFSAPGIHKVTITVLSGDCTGTLRRTTLTIEVDIAPRASTRRAFATNSSSKAALLHVADTAAAKRAAKACKDTTLKPIAGNHKRVGAAVLCLVNAARRAQGRKKLARSPRLERASAAHASDMVKRRYFEHERVPGGPTVKARLRKVGYRGGTFAENIVYGSNYSAADAVRAWINSPPHRANILHLRLKFAGVGVNVGIPATPARPGATYTMNFGRTLR